MTRKRSIAKLSFILASIHSLATEPEVTAIIGANFAALNDHLSNLRYQVKQHEIHETGMDDRAPRAQTISP